MANRLRASNMVRSKPSIRSPGLVERRTLLDGVEQRREPLQSVVLALHRYHDTIGGSQRIDRQHVQRGRTVDDDIVEVARQAG